MKTIALEPVQKWHTNNILKGWDESDDGTVDKVHDLPITQTHGSVVSIWKCSSLWARIKFLFHGEITFVCSSYTHPPIQIMMSDVVVPEYGSFEDDDYVPPHDRYRMQ